MTFVKTCALCGDEFKARRRTQIICQKIHTKECPVCKVVYDVKNPHRPAKTCSYKCAGIFGQSEEGKSLKKKEIEELARNRRENRKRKKCAYCHEEFTPTRKTQIYCSIPHKSECFHCKEVFFISRIYEGRYNYSCGEKECEDSLRKHTNIKKYGKENVFQAELIKGKIKDTLMRKYGVTHPSKSPLIMKRIADTMESRYNVKSPLQSAAIRDKMKQTVLSTYGVDNVLKSDEIKNKIKKTNLSKYGVELSTHIGIKNYDEYMNVESFLEDTDLSVKEIATYFNVGIGTIREKIKMLKLENKFDGFYSSSQKEQEFIHSIKEVNGEIDFVINDRKVLLGRELDFYFKRESIAIEISPTFTHNSKVGWNNKGKGKDVNYHIDKFSDCNKKGIELITIFDWYNWSNTIKLIINKLHYRNTFSKLEVDYYETSEMTEDLKDFLKSFTVHNDFTKKVKFNKIGVLIKDNSVIGVSLWKENEKQSVLIDIVSKLSDINISTESIQLELMSNYIRKPEIEGVEITAFSDNNLGSVEFYSKLNFQVSCNHEPTLHYYNEKTKEHVDCRNQKLTQREIDNLDEIGFLPVYDCGYTEWKLKK